MFFSEIMVLYLFLNLKMLYPTSKNTFYCQTNSKPASHFIAKRSFLMLCIENFQEI